MDARARGRVRRLARAGRRRHRQRRQDDTKDLAAAAIGAGRRVAANERSFNNEQGLPVTILNAPDDTEVLVLEMGMRGFGEIARLCDVARPTIGVVTAVGRAHTERVGGIDGVAPAKGELVEALPADGHGGAQRRRPAGARRWRDRTGATVLTFGESRDADVRVDAIAARRRWPGRRSASTRRGEPARCASRVSGAHMAIERRRARSPWPGSCGVDLDDGRRRARRRRGCRPMPDGACTAWRAARS